VYKFRFRAVRQGKATLRMEYRRPWEEGAPPESTFVLKASVK
jgi:predicted secreted protein